RACSDPHTIQSFSASASPARPPTPLAQGVHFWRLRGKVGSILGDQLSATWQFYVRRREGDVDTSWGSQPDFDGDGIADVALSANNANVVELIKGRKDWHDGGAIADDIQVIPHPNPGDGDRNQFVASAGDLNGDGFADVFVGSFCGTSSCPPANTGH